MKMEEARELLLKHLYLQGGDGLGISDGRVYNACLDAIMEALTLTDVSTRFSTRSFIIGCGCGMTLGLMLAIIIINVC